MRPAATTLQGVAQVLAALLAARAAQPHLRLGQFLVVATGNLNDAAKLFYRSDADLTADLLAIAKADEG